MTEDKTINGGVYAVHGTESHVMKTFQKDYVWCYKQVYLEEYLPYSKDAVVVEVGANEVTYYVNTTAVRKSDLLIGAWPNVDENGYVINNGGA